MLNPNPIHYEPPDSIEFFNQKFFFTKIQKPVDLEPNTPYIHRHLLPRWTWSLATPGGVILFGEGKKRG